MSVREYGDGSGSSWISVREVGAGSIGSAGGGAGIDGAFGAMDRARGGGGGTVAGPGRAVDGVQPEATGGGGTDIGRGAGGGIDGGATEGAP